MQLAELALEPRLAARLQEMGYATLYPSQERAAPVALGGRNLVLSVPTASGKSLVAYLAIVNAVLTRRTKCLYMAPLRALAHEKWEELREFRALGVRVGLSIGDLDQSDPRLGEYDVLVCTSEKADALLRHSAHWVQELGLIVADEVHLLNEPDRGPTLEVLLARFRQLNPQAQIIALSATVRNSGEVAEWLGAEHIQSDWRPVELREGVFYGRAITWKDGSKKPVAGKSDPVADLVADSLAGGGQCLVFVNTRKSTETVAEKLRTTVRGHLEFDQRTALLDVVKGLGGEEPTTVEGRLGKCVRDGVAFHHAGLSNAQRVGVERAFKAGHLRAIVATPTLAAGINLPARRVIVRDLWRYDSDVGNAPIPVMEYKQMAGRAGRPKYDTMGEAITLAKTLEQREDVLETYLLGKPEKVTSKLGNEAALRAHVLSSIASGFTPTEDALQRFLGSTFLARQSDPWVIQSAQERVLKFLRAKGFVEPGERLQATPYGLRTSKLYIDPLSAVALRDALERARGREVSELGWLHAACRAPDMRTLFIKAGDDWLEGEVVQVEPELLLPIPEPGQYEFFLGELKTALLLRDYINEVPEEQIEQRFEVYPGDVHNKVETAEWLIYAARELAHLFHREALKPLAELEARLGGGGVKRELLPLVKLRGVGRVRARALFRAGFKTLHDLRAAELPALVRVPGIGPGLAQNIKRELGQITETQQVGLEGYADG